MSEFATTAKKKASPNVESSTKKNSSSDTQLQSASATNFNFDSLTMQPKLKVSQPEDPYEQEADRVAKRVVYESASGQKEHLYKLQPHAIMKEELGGVGATSEPSGMDTMEQGHPLDASTRLFMESRFGYDFSSVRIHTYKKAAESADLINASAYTVGNDIVFAEGQYQPNNQIGRRLLAHELAHVVQQTATVVGSMAPSTVPMLRSPAQISRQEAGAPVNPEIASLPWGRYVDRFSQVMYDLDYRSEGGNLSRWLRVVYSDGTEIDINIFSDFEEVSLHPGAVRDAMAQGYIGDGGRIFPTVLNYQTVPRLWEARRSAIEAMEEFNFRFILATTPAVMFIITMPMAAMGGSGSAPRAVRRPGGHRIRPPSGIAGFSATESAIISETRTILSSSEMAQLRAAHAAGESVTVNIGGRIIQYEPGLPASGMTMFGENGFLLGREAFASEAELTKTLLHELHRLSTSAVRTEGATGAAVAAETEAAFQFAERAFNAVFR